MTGAREEHKDKSGKESRIVGHFSGNLLNLNVDESEINGHFLFTIPNGNLEEHSKVFRKISSKQANPSNWPKFWPVNLTKGE